MAFSVDILSMTQNKLAFFNKETWAPKNTKCVQILDYVWVSSNSSGKTYNAIETWVGNVTAAITKRCNLFRNSDPCARYGCEIRLTDCKWLLTLTHLGIDSRITTLYVDVYFCFVRDIIVTNITGQTYDKVRRNI